MTVPAKLVVTDTEALEMDMATYLSTIGVGAYSGAMFLREWSEPLAPIYAMLFVLAFGMAMREIRDYRRSNPPST
jgi:hypothetical protein